MLGSSMQSTPSNTLVSTAAYDIPDDILFSLGNDKDQVLLNRTATLTANTALTNVLIGTPVTPALAANSFILSNITADGDILIAVTDGGHSIARFWADGDTGDTALMAASGASADMYVGGSKIFDLTNDGTKTTLMGLSGDYWRIGDASTTGHSLASEDDLMVTGKLEVDGHTYLDRIYMEANEYVYADATQVIQLTTTGVRFQEGIVILDTKGLSTYTNDDDYFFVGAKDTGVGIVEVSRAQGAADPYFSMGGSQEFKVYNSGAVNLSGVVGIDYNPGSNVDTDLITVGVSDTPRIFWDESLDAFRYTKSAYFDASVKLKSAYAGLSFMEGATERALLKANITYDQVLLGVSTSLGTQFILTEYDNREKDHDHADQATPTFFVHSSTSPDTNNTQWISMTHNQTNGIIATGLGGLVLPSYLFIPEVAAADTDIAAHGQLWTKNTTPNELWFTDDAGNDHQLASFDTATGEMIVTSNQTATIETADTPHAFTGLATGTVNDFSFVAGITGAITAYADYDGTVGGTVKATCTTHGLVTDDIITIRGTTNYNGVFQITKIDNDEFYFTDTWVADDGASDFEMGDYLLAGTGTAGDYDLSWNSSVSEGGGAGGIIEFQAYINITIQTKACSKRKFANNDVGSIAGGGHLTIAVADRIWFAHQSDGINDLTVNLMNLRLARLA